MSGLNQKQLSVRQLQNLDLQRPSDKERLLNLDKTSQQLLLLVQKKNEPAFLSSQAQKQRQSDVFMKYTPSSVIPNQNQVQRIIQISTQIEDPLEPPKHKHKKVPTNNMEPPPVILRSPPRKLTAQDQKDWKVPACISNWKNAAGYTVPLHMRLQADGRGLQNNTINERHAEFADALYAAERQARKETEHRSKVQQAMLMAQALKREEEIKKLAILAKAEKTQLIAQSLKEKQDNKNNLQSSNLKNGSNQNQSKSQSRSSSYSKEENSNEKQKNRENDDLLIGKKRTHQMRLEEEAKRERERIKNERKREIVREDRIQRAGYKKTKDERDQDRDISEKIALGQVQPSKKETMYDQRLFNQTAGLGSGFGNEEDYNLYDKPLFADRTNASIYKNVKNLDVSQYVNDDEQEVDNIYKNNKIGGEVINQKTRKILGYSADQQNQDYGQKKYTQNLENTKAGTGRSKPVEFEKTRLETAEDDKNFIAGLQPQNQLKK